MSTQINVTVGSGGLSDKARQLQTAARQAQLEKERQQRIEAQGQEQRTANLAAAGRAPDGSPLYGPGFKQPEVERRPAASRSGQGLNLGHLWVFGDARRQTKSTGVVSAEFNGSSSTATDAIRGTQYDLLLGCGDGGQWQIFPDVGADSAPPLPADTFAVGRVTARELQSVSPQSADSFFVGRRKGGSGINSNNRFFEGALPCGQGNFIYIYGFTSVWDAFESEASYAVRGRFQRTDNSQTIEEFPFLGYQDPFTGLYTLQEIPDRLNIINFVESSTIEPVSFTGYRGKERRFAAYVCNNSSIREISIPAGIEPLLNAACPEPVNATRTVYIYSFGTPEGTFIQDIYTIPNPTAGIFGSIGLTTDVSDSQVYTPDVFRNINNSVPFTDPANIKTIPEKLLRGLADRRAGSWAAFQDTSTQPSYPWMSNFYRAGAPFYYALWPNKNEQPNLQIWDPNYASDWVNFPTPKRVNKATLNLSPNRIDRDGAGDNFFGPEYYNGEKLITVWDWDDPSYCRSMCKALGFTDADLTP